MTFTKELAVDLMILLFIAVLGAGVRHMHDGLCKEGHHDSIQAVAGTKAP